MMVRSSSVALWNGILAGPLAFAIVFELKYALIDFVCHNHAHWLFWILFGLGVILCAHGVFWSWVACHPERERGAWAGVRRNDRDLAPPAPPGPS
ncbi:MAG TPA: hypothetical protein VG323_05965, partial [Thermoanaerobaculia bacterium]|nr:hypothetical protein [Thermoanaerobaculia bacterium]